MVNGAVKKSFEISKIKLATKDIERKEGTVHSLSSTKVERIGKQKGQREDCVNIIAQLMGMPPDLKRHFMDQCSHKPKEIHMILGQREGGMMMHEILPEQMGLVQHWLLPNIHTHMNPLTENLIITGNLGIDGRLIDNDYPTLYPTKAEMDSLKRKLKAKVDLTADLGEKLQAEQFMPNEIKNSAYDYAKHKPRSESVRAVNEPYANSQQNNIKERGVPMDGTKTTMRQQYTDQNKWNEITEDKGKIEAEVTYAQMCKRCKKINILP